ncbi:histidine ammonia-lyase [Terricaulis sp.]|uniref:histidine ammonia-lyase n=1 Tax=Terricaulis sp. TaxID=2768686 RepID=UPI003783C987
MTVELTLSGELTIAQIENVAFGRAKVSLAKQAREKVDAFRKRATSMLAAELKVNDKKRVYGLNTGFGSNYAEEVTPAELERLQLNLIRSHCAGVGEPAPKAVVRATMLLRAASLARGHSVVRAEVIDALIELLNKDVTPAVPRHGSVSASGDLAPLSHIAAVVIGEGRILKDDGVVVPTSEAGVDFKRVTLQMKEGLALNNGCQYSNAWGALAAAKMRRLMDAAVLNTALHIQVMRGMGRPFREDLHALRQHPGSRRVAGWVYALLDGYQFKDVTTDQKFAHDGRIQDPYNLRCAAQVLGPCFDLIERAAATMEIEARSVTDNPIDLNTSIDAYDLNQITSGGHFHGMPLAVDCFGLIQAAGIMARLANMRCARIVDKNRNGGLGPQVRGDAPDSTESGLLVAEYTTAGLCNHIWGLAQPSHLMSMSTDSGQEDHVSMAANVAMRAHEAADRLAEILAIEMMFAHQGEHRHAAKAEAAAKEGTTFKPVTLGRRTAGVLEEINRVFKPVTADRELSWDVKALAEKVLSGDIARASGYDFPRH